MVMPNFLFGSGLGVLPPVPVAPNSSAFTSSDYCEVSVSPDRIRFTRTTSDGQGYEYTNPGARVRFSTNASALVVNLEYTNLVTRADTYNGVGILLVDGVEVSRFSRGQGPAGPLRVLLDTGTATFKTIEVVMPYCASVDFTGLSITEGAYFRAPGARPATRFVAVGDSITHGFSVSDVGKSWPYLLAAAKNYQIINHGYGSRRVEAVDGATAAALRPDVATYLIGYNNFAGQTPLAVFKASYLNFLRQFRAGRPGAKIFCITPLWTPNSFGALTLEMYRTQIREALSELADPLCILVEGEALVTNSITHFPDRVHPNDLGAFELASALAGIISM